MARFRFARGKVAQGYVRIDPRTPMPGDKPKMTRTRVIVRTKFNEGRCGRFRSRSIPN